MGLDRVRVLSHTHLRQSQSVHLTPFFLAAVIWILALSPYSLTSCFIIKMQPALPSGLFSATVGTEIGYQPQLPVNPEGKNMYIVAFNDQCR